MYDVSLQTLNNFLLRNQGSRRCFLGPRPAALPSKLMSIATSFYHPGRNLVTIVPLIIWSDSSLGKGSIISTWWMRLTWWVRLIRPCSWLMQVKHEIGKII
jgi:hypothetical protein